MKTILKTGLVITILLAWNTAIPAEPDTIAHSTKGEKLGPVTVITGFAADQVLHTTVDAVSYLTIYGSFSDVAGVSVASSSGCQYNADIFYWDEDTVVIEVISLGFPNPNQLGADKQILTPVEVTVTVVNPTGQRSTSPFEADPTPDEVP
jgi:hypothetical protein